MVFSAHSYLSIVNELGIKRSFRQSNRPPPHTPAISALWDNS
jgi:hypothetical protein